MSYKLTYFDIQGAAEKVRLAFVLSGVDFEDERIQGAQWKELKPKTKFGQLPLLTIDGGEPVAQSGAMLRYVGRLGNGSLYPTSLAEELRMNEIIGLSDDLDIAFRPSLMLNMQPAWMGMPEDYAKTEAGQAHIRTLRETFASTKLPEFLTHLQTALEAAGGQFFGGATPSLADCQLLPQLSKFQAGFIDHVPTTVLDGFPTILEWIARMKALPPVAKWYGSK